MEITREQQFILKLVSNELFDVPFVFDNIDGLDFEYIKKKVKEQKLDVIMLSALIKNNINNEYTNYLKKRQIQIILLTTNQEKEYRLLADLFDNNNIDYIPVKGTDMKDYYPSKDMRLMGDMDILIKENKRKEIYKLLTSNGYVLDGKLNSADHHDIYDHGKYGHFEIHFRLFSTGDKTMAYFDDNVWDNQDNHRLDDEFNVAYLCGHYAKHVRHGGGSYKSIIDIGLLMLKKNIDYDKLKDILIKSNLYDFFNNIIAIFNYSFNQHIKAFEDKFDEEELKELVNFLFVCGDFGFGDENDVDHRLAVNEMSKDGKITIFTKIKYLIKQVCLPYSQFKYLSKAVRYCPILLPFGWIWRLLRFMITKRDRLKERLSAVHNVKNQDIEDNKIIDKLLNK